MTGSFVTGTVLSPLGTVLQVHIATPARLAGRIATVMELTA